MINLKVRVATEDDFEQMWEIFTDVVSIGDTYVYSPETTRQECHQILMVNTYPYVATIEDKVVALYVIRQNKPALGSHVCNAGFMVDKKFRGQNIGRKISEHCLEQAKKLGFLAMQFNVVVATNKISISLWKSLDFKIIGTVPKGFKHFEKGLVDIHIMHRFL